MKLSNYTGHTWCFLICVFHFLFNENFIQHSLQLWNSWIFIHFCQCHIYFELFLFSQHYAYANAYGNILLRLVFPTVSFIKFLHKVILLSQWVSTFSLNKTSLYSICSSTKIILMADFWTLSRYSDYSLVRELCRTTQDRSQILLTNKK